MAGFDPASKQFAWYYALKMDNRYEGRRMFRHRDFLITSYLNDEKSGQAWILAFRPETGEVIWNHKADPRCMHNHGQGNYFHQTEKHIMYSDSIRGAMVVLDADTGEEVGTLPDFPHSNSFRAGDYTYLWYQDKMVRIPWKLDMLPKSWEAVGPGNFVTNAVVHEGRAFLFCPVGNDHDRLLVRIMDPDSWLEQSRLEFAWPTRYKSTVIAGPESGRLLLQQDNRVACLNPEVPEVSWDQEWEDEPTLLWTRYGICAREGYDTTFMLDPITGERREERLILGDRATDRYDYLFTNGTGQQISWFLEGKEGANPAQAEKIHARMAELYRYYYVGYTFALQWNDADVSAPDESLVVALPESGDILSRLQYDMPRKEKLWKKLEAAFAKFQIDEDVEEFSAVLVAVTGIRQVHPDIKEYFREGLKQEKIKGYKKPLGHLCNMRYHFLTYDHLIGMGPDEELFPGIYSVGSTSAGIEYILMLEGGWVLDIHHDSLSEYAWDYKEAMEQHHLEFARKFGAAYGKGPLGKWRSKAKN